MGCHQARQFAAEAIGLDMCETCKTVGQFGKCKTCKVSCYCSKECQRADWTKHRAECAQLRKKRKESWFKLKYFFTFVVVILFIIGRWYKETRSMIEQQDYNDDRGVNSLYEIGVRNAKLKVMDALEYYLYKFEVPGWKLFDHYMEHSDPTIPPRIRTDKILQKTLPNLVDLVIDHMKESRTKRFAEYAQTSEVNNVNGDIDSRESTHGYKILVNKKQFKVRVHRYQSCPKFYEGHTFLHFHRVNGDGLKFKQPFKSAYVSSFTFWCETSKNGKFKILNVLMKMVE